MKKYHPTYHFVTTSAQIIRHHIGPVQPKIAQTHTRPVPHQPRRDRIETSKCSIAHQQPTGPRREHRRDMSCHHATYALPVDHEAGSDAQLCSQVARHSLTVVFHSVRGGHSCAVAVSSVGR